MLNNPAYRSIIITSLIFLCLLLALTSIKLRSDKAEMEEVFAIEYIEPEIEEEKILKPETIAVNTIKTHRAYNEAAAFIDQLEQERIDDNEEFEKKIEALDNAIAAGLKTQESEANTVVAKEEETVTPIKTTVEANNNNSSNSYNLKDRTALYLPNPVYLCDAGGRIVITISVDADGIVTNAIYAASLSNSVNECLIDEALNYASKSTFNSKDNRPNQMGTITYNFQSQH